MWSFNYFCSLVFLLNVHWNLKLPANRTHVEVDRAPFGMGSLIPRTVMPEKQNLSSEQLPGQTRQGGGKVTISKILQKSQDLVPEHLWHLGDFPATISWQVCGVFCLGSQEIPKFLLCEPFTRDWEGKAAAAPNLTCKGNPKICSVHSKSWQTAAQQGFHREFSATRLTFSSLVRTYLLFSWKHPVTEAPRYSWLSIFLCPLAGWIRLQNMQEKAWKIMDRWENSRSLLEQLPGSCCFVLCFPAPHPRTRSLLSSRSRRQDKRISYSSQP